MQSQTKKSPQILARYSTFLLENTETVYRWFSDGEVEITCADTDKPIVVQFEELSKGEQLALVNKRPNDQTTKLLSD
jgi:hypothetical protein